MSSRERSPVLQLFTQLFFRICLLIIRNSILVYNPRLSFSLNHVSLRTMTLGLSQKLLGKKELSIMGLQGLFVKKQYIRFTNACDWFT